jgi:hypothetical protein
VLLLAISLIDIPLVRGFSQSITNISPQFIHDTNEKLDHPSLKGK